MQVRHFRQQILAINPEKAFIQQIMSSISGIRIMGIVNTTPDSFSDGGKFTDSEAAFRQAEQLITDGADILDIGGESTRPFAQPVPLEEELRRTIPVIRAIRQQYATPISIDTRKAEVARQAIDEGADIINDISGLYNDVDMAALASTNGKQVIIMHMQGQPETMQVRPAYVSVVDEIIDFLQQRIVWAREQGIAREKIIVDPGIGFGKTLEHNLAIIKNLGRIKSLGCSVLLGHSRKSFIGAITGRPPEQRDVATAVISALVAGKDVDILRVHDVASTRQALLIADALG